MRILLLAPIHREKEFLKQKGRNLFLKGQGQQSWVEALQELGHEVFVFRYTDSVLIPQIIRAYLSELFQTLVPIWKARYDRFKDAYYCISLENYLKNKRLLSLSHSTKPQLLIISGGVTSVFPQTIKKIKNTYQCKALLFSGVNPVTSTTQVEKIMIRNGIVDMVIENDRRYANLWKKIGGKKVIVLPISSVDPKLHRKTKLTSKEKKQYGCDVCFVGSLTRDRQEKIAKLIEYFKGTQFYSSSDQSVSSRTKSREVESTDISRQDGYQTVTRQARTIKPPRFITVKIWGDIPFDERLKSDLMPYYYGTAYGEKMVKIFNAAKIVLNFQPKDMIYGGNMRTFEIPGCGAFQLADKVDPDFFIPGKEVILFKNISDLKNKIKYYLQNEVQRLKIANNGFLKAHKLHTYQKHFGLLFNMINDKK